LIYKSPCPLSQVIKDNYTIFGRFIFGNKGKAEQGQKEHFDSHVITFYLLSRLSCVVVCLANLILDYLVTKSGQVKN
jgi:hypothetical protein